MATKPATKTVEAAAVHVPKKGNGTVTVACKFPAGLVLQLCRKTEYVEEGAGGTRINRVRWDKDGPTYTVRGPAMPNGQVPKGYVRPVIEGGYALTSNIPADFFEQWMDQNKDSPLVTNRIIFAATTRDAAEGQAQDQEEFRSGFEPIEPDSDRRIPRTLNPNVGPIETAERG